MEGRGGPPSSLVPPANGNGNGNNNSNDDTPLALPLATRYSFLLSPRGGEGATESDAESAYVTSTSALGLYGDESSSSAQQQRKDQKVKEKEEEEEEEGRRMGSAYGFFDAAAVASSAAYTLNTQLFHSENEGEEQQSGAPPRKQKKGEEEDEEEADSSSSEDSFDSNSSSEDDEDDDSEEEEGEGEAQKKNRYALEKGVLFSAEEIKLGHKYAHELSVLRSKEDKKGGEWQERDWMAEFQRLDAMPDSRAKYQALALLSRDFVKTASMYGRIVISEYFIPPEKKTIKPVNVGGLAGGEKFICRNIFFKLANDLPLALDSWMYGGTSRDDEKAMKASAHDLKSLLRFYAAASAIHREGEKKLNVPLTCLVDFRGYRLFCCAVVPISSYTLVYGSGDGGNTIHSDCEEFTKKVAEVCKILNLQPHKSGKDGVIMHGPGDLEGHIGQDGNYYILDLARLFPPEFPERATDSRSLRINQRAIFYNLLRPEFVYENSVPLSSDTFSAWELGDENARQHAIDVREATRLLKTVRVADTADALARQFEQLCNNSNMEEACREISGLLSTIMHQKGVNMRYLGLVREALLRSPSSQQRSTTALAQVLLVEMTARVLKNALRLMLREEMRTIKTTFEEPYKQITINFINTILGHRVNIEPHIYDKRPIAWLSFLEHKMEEKYNIVLSSQTIKGLMKMDMRLLLERFTTKAGVVLSSRVMNSLAGNKYAVVVDTDLKNVKILTKHMYITEMAEGTMLYMDAMEQIRLHNQLEALSLLSFARTKLNIVKDSGTGDPMSHLRLAITNQHLSRLIRCFRESELVGHKAESYRGYSEQAEAGFNYCLLLKGGNFWEARIAFAFYLAGEKFDYVEARRQLRVCFEMNGTEAMVAHLLAECPPLISLHNAYVPKEDGTFASLLMQATLVYETILEFQPENKEATVGYVIAMCFVLTITNFQFWLSVVGDKDLAHREVRRVLFKRTREAAEKALAMDETCLDKFVKASLKCYEQQDAISRLPKPGVFAQICSPRMTDRLKKLLFVEVKSLTLETFLVDTKSEWQNEEVIELCKTLSSIESFELPVFSDGNCKMTPVILDHIVEAFQTSLRCLTLKGGPSCWQPIGPFTKCTAIQQLTLKDIKYEEDLLQLSQHPLPQLSTLRFDTCDLTDQVLDLILQKQTGLTDTLQQLSLISCYSLTDEALRSIARRCEKLRVFQLHSNSNVTDEGIRSLLAGCKPSLRAISLDGLGNLTVNGSFGVSSPSKEGAHEKEESDFLELEAILIGGGVLADGSEAACEELIRILCQRCDHLKRFVCPPRLNAAGLAALRDSKTSSNIQLLNLRSCNFLEPDAFAASITFSNLCQLYVPRKFDDKGLLSLAKHCPKLESFFAPESTNLTDSGLVPFFQSCRQLRRLCIRPRSCLLSSSSSSSPQDAQYCEWLRAIGNCTSLEILVLRDSLNDGALSILGRHQPTSLRLLDLHSSRITDWGIMRWCEGGRCGGLRQLNLQCCYELTPVATSYIAASCSSLEKLWSNAAMLSYEAYFHFKMLLPESSLKYHFLSLLGVEFFSDEHGITA
ncbi:Clu domain-containing protein [Balamuthia mandrillaris]